jgi:hypothetical protein
MFRAVMLVAAIAAGSEAAAQVVDYGAAYNRTYDAVQDRADQRRHRQAESDRVQQEQAARDRMAAAAQYQVPPKPREETDAAAIYSAQAAQWERITDAAFGMGSLDDGAQAWNETQNVRDAAATAGLDIYPPSSHYEEEVIVFNSLANLALEQGDLRAAANMQALVRRALAYAQMQRRRGL